jgi:hypothetical protein
MGMFWKSKAEKKVDELTLILSHSFHNVKNDTQQLYSWILYLREQNQYQQKIIEGLKAELAEVPKTPEEIRLIVDHYYSFAPVYERIKSLNERVEKLATSQLPLLDNIHAVQDKVSELQNKPEQKPESRAPTLKEKILQRITKNSKNYVKNLILSFIRKYEKISALQLREMIVEEQGLCSKSSFYRMLEEIEKEEDISVINDGKQKHYMYQMMKKN